ncbi:hypothetical protein GZH47_11195 [Paenibacillus rhizovicinus]|uniref:Uncharacterized protein n=1 Tax=Paenibacillus rhizovicinus TaxID=2704463 RepID=A0A6C0NYN3_9BACL|nr:hypothetical protein [Paenibacillus rhizovicinus]QHW31354.1 hypothetical protein GZH47_11195 [Paenibacillus rhizovicinus]
MPSKREILQSISFGHRIAEDESQELANYFVETDHWKRIFSGEIDIVYGLKGTGKSAIYSLLQNKSSELMDKRINVIVAEKPRGTPAFKDIVNEPPTSEAEFITLWKLYFLSLIGFQVKNIKSEDSNRLVDFLEEARLLPRELNLRGIIKAAFDYAKKIVKAESFEGGLQFDPNTGMPAGVNGKITLKEPSHDLTSQGLASIDHLLELANKIIKTSDSRIWILIDRLDVAFADSAELEKNALRALFKVYLDMNDLENISLKIFLRSDIWKRVVDEGFRESSHITRSLTISWNPQSLLNLIMKRLLKNDAVVEYLGIDIEKIMGDINLQQETLYRIFPAQVDTGRNKPNTFDWLLSRTRDGNEDIATAPRELIHLLSSVREVQLKKLEIGGKEPGGSLLFDGASLKEALNPVSKVRLEQTLYAEYPQHKQYLEKLNRAKTEQTIDSLSVLWEVNQEDSYKIATKLVEIGFFKKTVRNTYWVPFLYRSALNMVQGNA